MKFQCKHRSCGRLFNKRCNLKRHLRAVHSMNSHMCDKCTRRYSSRRDLDYHSKRPCRQLIYKYPGSGKHIAQEDDSLDDVRERLLNNNLQLDSLSSSLSSDELHTLNMYRRHMESITDTGPTLGELDHDSIVKISSALENGHKIGLSGMKVWECIAVDLIHDKDVLITLNKMDKSPFRKWLDVICAKHWGVTIYQLIEASIKLEQVNVASYLRSYLYDCGFRYACNITDNQRADLTRILECDAEFPAISKDYERELEVHFSQETIMGIVLYYLKKWKPDLKLHRLRQICVNEHLVDGWNIIYKLECSY